MFRSCKEITWDSYESSSFKKSFLKIIQKQFLRQNQNIKINKKLIFFFPVKLFSLIKLSKVWFAS